ncbi:MAG: T9SS type A sorting domain-containing protein [Bacteroidota bacterium]|nr:T9SS type A sorting domain-containing protein [Bacteroidota bacterium]
MKTLFKTALLSFSFSLLFSITAKAQDSAPLESPDFKVFPNPNQGEDTYVSLKGFVASDLLVVVYDMLGREIYSKVELMENEGFLFTIATDGKKLPSGIYLITASANDKVFRERLIVK